jgi:23S rRNA pseudouridine2457 synthase
VAKKRDWPVHATRDPQRPHLHGALRAFLRNRDGVDAAVPRMHHRLDVHTSGVVLFSLSDAGARILARLFEKRQITKRYRAVVIGAPPPEGELRDWVAVERVGRFDQLVRKRRGKPAALSFRTLSVRQGLAELEITLGTGRMHQIRAQCAWAGFPVLGDPLYGDPETNRRLGVSQQRLHAWQLAFDDPTLGPCVVESPGEVWPTERVATGHRYVVFHKPFGVLCQFTTVKAEDRCLADFGLPSGVYPVGRLDKDSEGLLLLTDDGVTKDRLASPTHHTRKTYWAQVERVPDAAALASLRAGVQIKGYRTRPCEARLLDGDPLPPRDPPIRYRKSVPTCWVELVLTEGRNRQVRRMTAAVGHPTLRLVRVGVGRWGLDALEAGQSREVAGF